MAIEIMGQKIGRGWFKAATDEDVEKTDAYKDNQLVQISIKGVRKERSYRELCCYKGSCKYIANMNFSEQMDTPVKVDFITKIRCGFIESMIVDSKMGQTHFIPKSLSYKNCDQPEGHKFIADALEKHAELVGMDNAEDYVQLLNDQK